MALSSPQVITENRRRVKIEKYYCDLCCTNCTTAEMLAQHLLGNKHKRYLQANRPQEVEIRLSYFLKTYMEKEPIVGLEYILEVKKDSLYTYCCQLCGLLICHLPTIVDHLIDQSHIECYIKKHFWYLFPRFSRAPTKRDYVKGLRDAAVKILELQGNKKEIQTVLPESDRKTSGASEDTPPSKPESDCKTRGASKDTPPSKPESDCKSRGASKDTPPSKPESGNLSHSKLSPLQYQEPGLDESRESYRYIKMLQKSSSNDPPLAKRSRRSPGGDQDALPSTAHISKHGRSHYNKSHAIRMDCTATQELEFKTNDEFLEYFANFVISDDEDALFIRTITLNCIKALTSFQEEDAERQKTGHQPEAPLKDTSRTAQEILSILEDESHLSDSETSLLKDNSNPLSDAIPKNVATNSFFNRINVIVNPRTNKNQKRKMRKKNLQDEGIMSLYA